MLLSACAGGVVDTFESFVWEPSVVKINALTAAAEAACLVSTLLPLQIMAASCNTARRSWPTCWCI